MHRLFRKALDNATGKSESIIAVVLDIRDFSGFSQRCDSVEVAAFIRKVYMEMISEYFPFASFYKPTGDGLLLIIHWDEKVLEERSQEVIDSCIKCHSRFGDICKGDPTINFKVPDKIGIGVARGSGCRLVSGNRTIDYAGRLLNLTARLTDLARPSGIVIDGDFVIELLTEEQQKLFEEDHVYLKGIAEKEAVRIYLTPKFTEITRYNKQPIVSKRWREKRDNLPYGELVKLGGIPYVIRLPSEAVSPNDVEVQIVHERIVEGEVYPTMESILFFGDFKYQLQRGKPVVILDFPKLCKTLARRGLKEDMEVTISVAYAEK